jgi:hypothetical protein
MVLMKELYFLTCNHLNGESEMKPPRFKDQICDNKLLGQGRGWGVQMSMEQLKNASAV